LPVKRIKPKVFLPFAFISPAFTLKFMRPHDSKGSKNTKNEKLEKKGKK